MKRSKKYPIHKRRGAKKSLLGILSIIFLCSGIAVILLYGVKGRGASRKPEINIVPRKPEINSAIYKASAYLGVPRKNIRFGKETEGQIKNVTIIVNSSFPPAFVNHVFQKFITDAGGIVYDAVEKGWSVNKILLAVGDSSGITHRIKLIRRHSAPVESVYVALLIDDFCVRPMRLEQKFFKLGIKLSAGILPSREFTRNVVTLLAEYPNVERIVHLPMEPRGYPDIDPGPDAILTSMSDKRIMELTMKDIDQIPGAVGVSNHMGSLATENQRVMRAVMMILRQRGLFWVDSRTTIYTVFAEIAQELGVKAAKIDHLLDPEGFSKEQIEQRLFEYCLGSRGKPAVILNAHVSDTILSILAKDIPVLKRYGVKFIWVSEAIRRKAQWHRKSQKI